MVAILSLSVSKLSHVNHCNRWWNDFWSLFMEKPTAFSHKRLQNPGVVTSPWWALSMRELRWTRKSQDDVIKGKHFPHYWSFVRGIHRSPVNSPHKGQWRGVLMFPLISEWTNGWVNNREDGDLRRRRAHYNVIVMHQEVANFPTSLELMAARRNACCVVWLIHIPMMTSSNKNIFGVTGLLWGKSTGHRWIPLTKASDVGFWCFLWCAPGRRVEQIDEMLVIWDTMMLIVSLTHCNALTSSQQSDCW